MDTWINRLSIIAIVAVVLTVLLGVVRIALYNFNYFILLAIIIAAVYYMYKRAEI